MFGLGLPRGLRRERALLTSASAAALASAVLFSAPSLALVPNNEVGPDGAVDVANQWAGVGQMFNWNTTTGSVGLCTGQLINPRTVIFAAHCVDDISDESYGALTGGRPISFAFDPENAWPTDLLDWRDAGFNSVPENNLFNVIQVQTVNNAPPGNFPLGDVALAAFDTHIDHLPTYGMLFSPITESAHAALVGYGGTGDGTNGDYLGIDFKRRAGENMVDGLFSQNDFIAGVFNVPGASFEDVSAEQLLYHLDFDRPDRDPNDCARGEFFGFGNGNDVVCNTPPFGASITWDNTSAISVSDQVDWYPGDALPGEAGTAGGDSGGGLFLDEIYDTPLIAGVLSGGWTPGIFSPAGGYGDVSYYNPLFVYRDWIQENNPYVYASARTDSYGYWSDPHHWVQGLDPNYYYIDENGVIQNGVPSEGEPGPHADAPKWGTVFDLAIPDDVEGDTGLSPEEAAALAEAGIDTTTFYAELDAPIDAELGGYGHAAPSGPTAGYGEPTGLGSTGFVPNNDWGTYGTWTGPTDGVARFYDVTLGSWGYTELDMNVEIDRLTLTGQSREFYVPEGYELSSLIAVEQDSWGTFAYVDGTISTREYMLWQGFLLGEGVINAETVYNVGGHFSPGGSFSIGSFTINGDYVQASAAEMYVNVLRGRGGSITNDFTQINGEASLAGMLLVLPENRRSVARWGDSYTILNADNVVGEFDYIGLDGSSPVLYPEAVYQADGDYDIVVRAHRLRRLLGSNHPLYSLGGALDDLRWGGRLTDVEGVFDLVDTASADVFESALFSITPNNAFMQLGAVTSFNNSFTSHLAARGAELRAGARGLSANGLRGAFAARERAGAADVASAALTTEANANTPSPFGERFGMFVSSRGSFDNGPMGAETGFGYDPFARIAESRGDLAVGADMRLTDNLAVGVALTTSRFNLTNSGSGTTPLSNETVGAAAYATAYGDGWHLDGYYGFAEQDFELERLTAGVDASTAIAFGAPEGSQMLAGVSGGWTFTPAEGLSLGPVASVNYSHLELAGYRESVADDFALLVDARDVTSVTAELGAQFRYARVTDAGRLFSAFGEFSAVREFGDTADIVTAAFVNAPDARFSLEQLLDDEWFSASAGVTYALSPNLTTRFELVSDFDRGALDNHYATAGFNWRF